MHAYFITKPEIKILRQGGLDLIWYLKVENKEFFLH